MNIVYDKVKSPVRHKNYVPVPLTQETMSWRRDKILQKMKERNLDVLLVYGDREHSANFSYLTGWGPSFEEAMLVLHADGACFLLLGNEMLVMAKHALTQNTAIHVPHFSLPDQPMETEKTMEELFREAGLKNGQVIGSAGWKRFSSRLEDNSALLDTPAFIIDTVRKINPDGKLIAAGGIFNDSADGARVINNANEIAFFEYGAGLASSCMIHALEAAEVGKTELEIGAYLAPDGQLCSVTTTVATGEMYSNASIFPRNKKISLGDTFVITLALAGGLTHRKAYAVSCTEEMPENAKDWLEKVAIPYYKAVAVWMEMIGIGVVGKEIYKTMQDVLPQEEHGWGLCPGHLIGIEEWLASPITPVSDVKLCSGMLMQMDIIVDYPDHFGANAEDCFAIADEDLRKELAEKYPETWARMQNRRAWIKNELGIELKEEILPMSDMCADYRPYIFNRAYGLKKA